MHIDNLLKRLPAEFFETIRPGSEKQHLYNHLSLLKADRRLTSDHRGNWRLAEQEGEPVEVGSKLATIDAVLDYVRQEQCKLDRVRRGLETLRALLIGG